MKKKIVFLAIIGMLLSGTSAFAATSVQLNLNGSIVYDSAAYIADNGSAYVTVDTFAKYYGAKVDWDAKSNVLKLNDTVVSDTYGNADAKSGAASIRAMTNALGGNHSAIG